MRSGQQSSGVSEELRRGILGGSQRVDLRELEARALAGLRDCSQPAAADLGLKAVDGVRVVEEPRAPQVFDQVLGGCLGVVGQCNAGERQQRMAERGAIELRPPVGRHRDPVAAEHVLDERRRVRRRAVHDRDFVPGHAGPDEGQHLGGGQLGLGELATGLEQRDRVSRIDPLGRGLEQLALEVVQCVAAFWLVVVR